ncbi:DUF2845 domain-containing protein [Pseudomonas turukhanskensis]|uniref:DUF2845 domain-containing protein n=1 Tax=Pseudomonas turukhanskensis TaxID=1806536 RepID=A0A9W6NHT6_9PSED|nr:DUF2845 domain-containing protein [Pseudomonas turukhanskensis]GLK91091.1 hypothetical protein GCM10017655_41550 [Pseudomonas turukhanskensis]
MKKSFLLCLPLMAFAAASHASLRCDNGIASEGDRTVEVQTKCGAPASSSVVGYEKTRHGSSSTEVEVQEWVYGPREGGMMYFLRFEGGRLVRIDSKRA